jgi:hypothetical protein
MRASSTYSIKQLRSKEWTEKWGDESSIMDYGRFNYVAQPGDGARLIPKLGPYDYFAIEYGYGAIPGAKTPAEEVPALKAIANRQTQNPMLRFGNQSPEDPTRQSEDLGDDSVEATRLGLKNIDRVMGFDVNEDTFGENPLAGAKIAVEATNSGKIAEDGSPYQNYAFSVHAE